MKISRHDKTMLLEQEFLTLLFVAVLGFAFHYLSSDNAFYLIALNLGFILYFWMIHEEKVHETGKKHAYFEHTSSYVMIAQTALALQLVSRELNWNFFLIMCMIISVIMYSVALSRIVMFKVVFRNENKK